MPLRAALAALALAAALAGCNPARGVPILLWHSVGEGSAGDGYDLPPEEFDRELSAIEAAGASAVSLDALFDARAGGAPLPARAVVLTFDDGRACLFRFALPVLLKHHMAAEAFVVPAWLGEDEAHRQVVEGHPHLLWSELAQMAASGAFHVQSHSLDHRAHTALSLPEMHAELVDSRRILTERLGVSVNFFAYPFGGFNTPYRDEVEAVGYRAALAVGKGPGTRYGLLRTSLHRGEEAVLARLLADAFGAAPPR